VAFLFFGRGVVMKAPDGLSPTGFAHRQPQLAGSPVHFPESLQIITAKRLLFLHFLPLQTLTTKAGISRLETRCRWDAAASGVQNTPKQEKPVDWRFH
jgi:hypothetical protein